MDLSILNGLVEQGTGFDFGRHRPCVWLCVSYLISSRHFIERLNYIRASMPEQVVDTNRKEKQQFWKRLGIGCRTLGKMTLDTAVKNRSVIIEVRFLAIYFSRAVLRSRDARYLFQLWPTLLYPAFLQLAYMGCSLLGSFLILRWALTRTDSSRTLKAKVRMSISRGIVGEEDCSFSFLV